MTTIHEFVLIKCILFLLKLGWEFWWSRVDACWSLFRCNLESHYSTSTSRESVDCQQCSFSSCQVTLDTNTHGNILEYFGKWNNLYILYMLSNPYLCWLNINTSLSSICILYIPLLRRKWHLKQCKICLSFFQISYFRKWLQCNSRTWKLSTYSLKTSPFSWCWWSR